MTVLERDTQGLDGWWLCSLHGRQGIVPGNRLKILVGMYDKQAPPTPQTSSGPALPRPPLQGGYRKPLPSSQYTSMHPAYSTPGPAPATPDSIYMMPPSHGKPSPQSVYQVPPTPQGPPKAPQKKHQPVGQDIYQVPPSVGPAPSQDVYQIPLPVGGPGSGQDIYQVPPSMSQPQDIYQIPPSLEMRSWESSKSLGKVRYDTQRDTGAAQHTDRSLTTSLRSNSDILSP